MQHFLTQTSFRLLRGFTPAERCSVHHFTNWFSLSNRRRLLWMDALRNARCISAVSSRPINVKYSRYEWDHPPRMPSRDNKSLHSDELRWSDVQHRCSIVKPLMSGLFTQSTWMANVSKCAATKINMIPAGAPLDTATAPVHEPRPMRVRCCSDCVIRANADKITNAVSQVEHLLNVICIGH